MKLLEKLHEIEYIHADSPVWGKIAFVFTQKINPFNDGVKNRKHCNTTSAFLPEVKLASSQ